MRMFYCYIPLLLTALLLFATSCSSRYEPVGIQRIASLETSKIHERSKIESAIKKNPYVNMTCFCKTPLEQLHQTHGVSIIAKRLTQLDCQHYFDRDIIRAGYQPIQIDIQNTSNTPYLFATHRINLPLISPKEVAKRLSYTSVGRIASYGAAALLGSPLFAVPALIDGFKPVKTNQMLEQELRINTAHDCMIAPHTHTNMIVFIPNHIIEKTFTITLLDASTKQPIEIIANY